MSTTTVPPSIPQPARRVAAREPPTPPNPIVAEAEQQWIFSEDELRRTPSIIDGMTVEAEQEVRKKGANFVLQVGMMLKLPQTTLSTACVFFNRFLMRRTLVKKEGTQKPMHHYEIAATALFLATKVEENVRKMKDLIVACVRVARKDANMLVDEQTKDYWRWRDTILYNEDVLLEVLCFDLSLEPTYKIMYEMLKYLGVEHNKRLRDAAWAFLNDSNSTPLCVLFDSRTIAAAALYAGAMMCGIQFPDDEARPWWEVQYVKLKNIRRACNYMVDLYENVQNKDGSHSIYVGLRSDDEDSPDSRTRLRLSQTPMSPGASSFGMERSASDQSLKRKRDDGASMERTTSEQSFKRRREDGSENGNGNGEASHRRPSHEKLQNGDGSAHRPGQNGQTSQHELVRNGVTIQPLPRKPETNGATKAEPGKPAAAPEPPKEKEDDVSEEGEVEE